MDKLTAETITDDHIRAIAGLPVASAIEFGRRNVALYALEGRNSGLRLAARERCAHHWNAIWEFDLDDVRKLWHAHAIDTATHDDAMIDYTTQFPTHIAARWAALARCADAINAARAQEG